MTQYKDSGVNVELGDACSKMAYGHAQSTFPGRVGMIGEPVLLEGGFAGLLDMGEYYLVQNDDGVGTKVAVAHAMKKYDTLGYDLLAMVVDDAVCLGAEPVSITNTIDIQKVEEEVIDGLMKGLAAACLEHKVVIAGGEIAELNKLINGFTWNAAAVGVVGKDKVITGSAIKPGDTIVGLRSDGFRSNGLSLVREILTTAFGESWVDQPFDDERSWGQVVLIPSRIYASCILDMVGRYGQPAKASVKGVAHVTGGGVRNLKRILKKNKLGAILDRPFEPHSVMLKLQELGEVSDQEAYGTWNMGTGMMVVSTEPAVVVEIAAKYGIEAQLIGTVTDRADHVEIVSRGKFSAGETLVF